MVAELESFREPGLRKARKPRLFPINGLNGASNSVSIKKVYLHLSFACLIVFDLINVIEAACCLSLFILHLLISSFISIWILQIRCLRLIMLL